MRGSEAATTIDEILVSELGQLTEDGRLSVLPSEVVKRWGISESDVRVLESFGLPPARDDGLLGISAAFQASADPALEGGLFEVGAYGAAKIGLRATDGSVRAVSRYGPTEVHPQLRALGSDGNQLQVVNFSLATFVEFSWRWHWILPVLAEQQIAAGEEEVQAWSRARTDAERAALPDFYADVKSLCGKVLRRYGAVDQQVVQRQDAFWRTVVMEYL